MQREFVTADKLRRLNELIGRQSSELRLGDHLLYLNPHGALDPDGYYSYQAPHELADLPRYKRRMWTHGEMQLHRAMPLDTAYTCHESIKYVKPVADSCFVCVARQVRDNNNLYVTELRTLMYTNQKPVGVGVGAGVGTTPTPIPTASGSNTTTTTLTDIDIVRYCQLTNNPHRIHWDARYAQTEGYTNLLAPGPLLLHLLLQHVPPTVTTIKYKNLQPVYPGFVSMTNHDKAVSLSITGTQPHAVVWWG